VLGGSVEGGKGKRWQIMANDAFGYLYLDHHCLGAPKASGIRSTEYLRCVMYIIGTPGTCAAVVSHNV
jgi:hypothetical protein